MAFIPAALEAMMRNAGAATFSTAGLETLPLGVAKAAELAVGVGAASRLQAPAPSTSARTAAIGVYFEYRFQVRVFTIIPRGRR
jgi:hypothetical protein